jgi:ATP-dependent RNA helicase DHX29
LDIDPTLRDRIVNTALEFLTRKVRRMILQASYNNVLYVSQSPKPIEESEEKAVGCLGIAYGVLRRLGFDEALVENCLRWSVE